MRSSKGFTLVEILVVLVIMAVVIALAVLSISITGRDSQLDEESRRIRGLVDLLHERALLEGRDCLVTTTRSISPIATTFSYVCRPTRPSMRGLRETTSKRSKATLSRSQKRARLMASAIAW